MSTLPKGLRLHLLVTDLGFLVYWLVTALALLPASWLFKDYQNPILVAWNWSFAPLDLLASVLGLFGVWAHAKSRPHWHICILLSMALTSCAGLMALSFWTLRCDFDLSWWLPNLYLLVWPAVFGLRLVRLPRAMPH